MKENSSSRDNQSDPLSMRKGRREEGEGEGEERRKGDVHDGKDYEYGHCCVRLSFSSFFAVHVEKNLAQSIDK